MNKFDTLVEEVLTEKTISWVVANNEGAAMGVFKTEDDAKYFQQNAYFGYYKKNTKIVPSDNKYAKYDDPKAYDNTKKK